MVVAYFMKKSKNFSRWEQTTRRTAIGPVDLLTSPKRGKTRPRRAVLGVTTVIAQRASGLWSISYLRETSPSARGFYWQRNSLRQEAVIFPSSNNLPPHKTWKGERRSLLLLLPQQPQKFWCNRSVPPPLLPRHKTCPVFAIARATVRSGARGRNQREKTWRAASQIYVGHPVSELNFFSHGCRCNEAAKSEDRSRYRDRFCGNRISVSIPKEGVNAK